MHDLRGGVIVIDKPPGLTSHDVVHVIRRALGGVRVGHTGTLDPFATGVLPLVIGRATRLAQFYAGADKEYAARIRLGTATDTYDGTGEITAGPDPSRPMPDWATVARALAEFVGVRDQVPPPFSAKKTGGTPAYERARRGLAVALPAVRVTAHTLEVTALEGEWVDVRVHCSAGYYVRSLAHDLGQYLGVGAHLSDLRRTRSGPFGVAQAVGLEPLLRDPPVALQHIVPLEALLPEIPAVTLTQEGAAWVRHGRPLGQNQIAHRGEPVGEGRIRLFGPDGQLLAVADVQGNGLLHPGVVLV